MKWFFGCDPGWTNLAYAFISEDDDLITGVLVPKDIKGACLTPFLVHDNIGPKDTIVSAAMERFVYFKGVHNPDSERILMVTGQMQFWLAREFNQVPMMFRSYDWKNTLSRHLFKKGFRNPSESLDKEFSIAAAEFIFEQEFDTDHEADAACLAYLAKVMAQ